MTPDYDKLRIEYIHSSISLRELADKHDISYDALRQQASRQEWAEERARVSQVVTATATATQTVARIDELSEFNRSDLQMAKALKVMAAKRIQEAQDPVNGNPLTPAELRSLASTVSEAQKIGRLALGASTANTELSGKDGGAIPVANVPVEEYKDALKQALNDY